MQNVVGFTGSRERAFQSAKHLRDNGFENEISIIWRHGVIDDQGEVGEFQVGYDDNLWDGATTGASLGALGGLLVGIGLITVPVLGPVAAVGPITGLLIGTAAGSLAGAVVDWGISPEGGRDIEEALASGKTVIIIQCPDEQIDFTIELLKQHGIHEVVVH